MTSIIKVDEIQLSDGTTPTASGLGLAALTSSDMPAGTALQTKFSEYSTTISTTSSAWVSTGLSVTITPTSANSKFLLQWNQQCYMNTSSVWEGFRARVRRGTVTAWTDNYTIAHAVHNHLEMKKCYDSYLDTPNTTSSITYAIEVQPSSSQAFSLNHGGAKSQLIVTEISG